VNTIQLIVQWLAVFLIGGIAFFLSDFFSYMPYMHSESALVHTLAVALFEPPGMEDSLRFELRHQAIIGRFGRYPHRNALLGRESTPEELAFLSALGLGFEISCSGSRMRPC
jgi:uncharacterized protein (DUF924 family)